MEKVDYIFNKKNPFSIEDLEEQKKIAESWAEGMLDLKELKKKFEGEFKNFILYGKTSYYGNKRFFEDLAEYTEKEFGMTPKVIVDRFKEQMTEKEIKKIKDDL